MGNGMNMAADISVLMSVYFKEKPEYIRECFESLLRQTLQANEWVVVEDGKLKSHLNGLSTTVGEVGVLKIARCDHSHNFAEVATKRLKKLC